MKVRTWRWFAHLNVLVLRVLSTPIRSRDHADTLAGRLRHATLIPTFLCQSTAITVSTHQPGQIEFTTRVLPAFAPHAALA